MARVVDEGSTSPGNPSNGYDPASAFDPKVKGRLCGVVVADFSRVLAGPLATMMLGDLGATVIKVERPDGGDDTRAWGPPFVDGVSTYYLAANRNKRSVALDLSSHDGREYARRLAERADVLVENFLPGHLRAFGLDAETLLVSSPRLVYCSITGFGDENHIPGYDFLVQAMGGLMSITGEGRGTPFKVGVALVDVLSALNAVIAIQAALCAREQTGRGQRVSVNLFSTLLGSLANQISSYINTGEVPQAIGNRHPSVVPYETFPTSDGVIALAVGNDRQFASLCEVAGLPQLPTDARFATNSARVENHDELFDHLCVEFQMRTSLEWTNLLSSVGVPAGPVNDLAQAIELANRLDLDPIVTFNTPMNHVVSTIASPLRLSTTPVTYRLAPPALGADTDEVLQWLEGRGDLIP